MLHGKPPVSARCMIERRCLITGYGSTGSFPGDFVELENGFVSPPARGRAAVRSHFTECDFLVALHGPELLDAIGPGMRASRP